MQVLAVLAKYNTRRGVISWAFGQENGEYKAVRNDGREFHYMSREDMRSGYAKIRDEYKFVRIA